MAIVKENGVWLWKTGETEDNFRKARDFSRGEKYISDEFVKWEKQIQKEP